MIVSNMNEFGGLEEFAKNLAVGVQRQDQEVSVLSTVWVQPDNQYLSSLRKHGVTVVQLPRWLSSIAFDSSTRDRMLAVAMWLSTPLVYMLGTMVMFAKRRSWSSSIASARSWLHGQWSGRLLGPNRHRPFVRWLLNWWRLQWRPDLLHIHGYTSSLLYVIEWAHKKKLPVVYEEHQTPDSQFDWWQEFEEKINLASVVIAVSEASAQALRKVCGVTQPVEVVYYMVPDPFDEGWAEPGNRGNGNQSTRVTTNARLYVTKGLTYLLEAIAVLKRSHPDTQFRVYGDGPLRGELLSCAGKLGLDGSQIFTGAFTSRGELDHIMGQTDIFVLSSILEGLPIALLEAMSYGRAIVATPVGGIGEAIQDGVNGLLCPPRDPDQLAQKIRAFIEDPDLRRRLGRAARQSYEKGPYNPASVCSRYISIYEKVIADAAR